MILDKFRMAMLRLLVGKRPVLANVEISQAGVILRTWTLGPRPLLWGCKITDSFIVGSLDDPKIIRPLSEAERVNWQIKLPEHGDLEPWKQPHGTVSGPLRFDDDLADYRRSFWERFWLVLREVLRG